MGAPVRGALVAAALAAATASGAWAASVSSLDIRGFARTDVAGAQAAHAGFLAGGGLAPGMHVANHRVEDFSGHQAWNGTTGTTNPTGTGVGSFTSLGGIGRGQSAVNGGTGLEVRNDSPLPWARHSVTNPGGNWLDSNDTYGMRWEVGGVPQFNALSFFLTDVADVGAKLSLTIGGTLYENVIGGNGREANGTIHWVHILLGDVVDNLVVELRHDVLNDGFSIEGVTVAHVAPIPLPPALALMLTGGLALFGLRRRAGSAPSPQ